MIGIFSVSELRASQIIQEYYCLLIYSYFIVLFLNLLYQHSFSCICHFLSLLSKVWCHRTNNYAYFCLINGNPASVGGYNQVVQDWLHVMVKVRLSFHKPITGYSIWWDFPHIYSFLEFFWRCKISYNSHKFQIKISWINIP